MFNEIGEKFTKVGRNNKFSEIGENVAFKQK